MSGDRRAAEGAAARRESAARGLRSEPAPSGMASSEVYPGLVAALGEMAAERRDPSGSQLLQAVQRQAVVTYVGQRQGNRSAQALMRSLWPVESVLPDAGASGGGHPSLALVQRVPEGAGEEEEEDVEERSSARVREMRAGRAEEAAERPLTEIEVTPEEAMEDIYGRGPMPSSEEIEENMRRELAMTEGTETLLYINMPGLIGGMPYSRERMQPTFQALREARDQITRQPAYAQWRENPADPARRAALDELIAAFEAETGSGIRAEIRDYWQGRQAGDPAGATAIGEACGEVSGALRAERERLFPMRAEAAVATEAPEGSGLPQTLEIADAEGAQSRLREQYRRVSRELVPGANRLSLGALGSDARAGPVASLSRLKSKIDQAVGMVRSRLRGAAVSRLDSRLAEAVQLAAETSVAFDRLAEQMSDYNRRATLMATAVMDASAVPILVPTTRQTAAVTFRGERTTYHTRHESRMSYYEQAYMLTGTTPARTPDEAPARGERPGSAREGRVGDVFRSLRSQNVAVSEAKILAAIAYSEGSFGSTQTVDMVRFSWGILSFQGGALMNLLRRIRDDSPAVFAEYFESFGITIRERGRTSAPVERESREMAGREEGFQSHEAYGVQDLVVYDHRARVWVSGNEGLAVIQGDPRYQALFVAAGSSSAVQTAQMMEARRSFVHGVRNQSLTLGEGDARRSIRVRDFVNNEVAMFGLVERKVANGNIGFATQMFNRYLQDRGIAAADLESRAQPDIADWVRSYAGSFRWELADHLEPAGVDPLRNDAYEGDV